MRKQSVLRKKTQVLQVVTLQTVFGEQGSGLLRGWFGQRTVLKMAVSERDFPGLPSQRQFQRIVFATMKKSIEQLNREANRALAQYRKARNVTTLLLIAIILSGIMVAIIYSL